MIDSQSTKMSRRAYRQRLIGKEHKLARIKVAKPLIGHEGTKEITDIGDLRQQRTGQEVEDRYLFGIDTIPRPKVDTRCEWNPSGMQYNLKIGIVVNKRLRHVQGRYLGSCHSEMFKYLSA